MLLKVHTVIFNFFLSSLLLILSSFFGSLYAQNKSLIAPPVFSHDSGFYPKAFDLKLQHSDPNVKIYYTLDGSIPDPENIKGSTYHYKNKYAQPPNKPSGELLNASYRTYFYIKPIHIEDRRYQPDRLARISTTFDKSPNYFPKEKTNDTWLNKIIYQTNRIIKEFNRAIKKINRFINYFKKQNKQQEYVGSINLIALQKEFTYLYKGTPLRVLAVDPNKSTSDVISKVFFIGKRNDFTLPIVNITVPEKELFDYENGVFIAGKDYDEWLSDPKEKLEKKYDRPANWKRKGDNIKAHMSFFDKNNLDEVDEYIDIRVNGFSSRMMRNKTIRVYPRSEYNKNGINYSLFSDEKPLGFSRILLRNAGQHSAYTYFADAAVQRAMSELNFGIQRYRPIVMFINGEYYGILNARDRHDKYYLSSRFNLPNNKVDILDNNKRIKKGNANHWNKTLEFVKNASKESNYFFSELEKLIDVESFIDYQCTEIFIANIDWPRNNIRYWRYRGSNNNPINQEAYTDGRWRWLLFDLDLMGGVLGEKYNYDYNALTIATKDDSERGWSTFMLRTLLENPEFKQRFIARFSDLLNSTYQSERMKKIIRETEAGIESEMPRHIARWSAPKSIEFWREAVNDFITFFEQRPVYQWQHLQEFFELDERYTVFVSLAEQGSGTVQLNSLILGEESNKKTPATDMALNLPWSGQYFQNLPLNLFAKPAPGFRFSHWELDGLTEDQANNPKLQLKPESSIKVRVVMEKE